MEDFVEWWVYYEKGKCLYTFTLNGLISIQITKVALERSEEQCEEYLSRISKYEASQLVFVDESAVDWRTSYRGCAWSICGTKAQRKVFFMCGQR
jgi:hypothetical protein